METAQRAGSRQAAHPPRVREDGERRLLDRMEGAAAVRAEADRSAAVATALLVGFDFAVREDSSTSWGRRPPEPNVTGWLRC